MMFVVIVMMIVSGVMVEWIYFVVYIVSVVVVSGLIYLIFGVWVWGSLFDGEGWLKVMGFIDFVGLMVVYLIGGWVVLVGIIVLGFCLGWFGCNG